MRRRGALLATTVQQSGRVQNNNKLEPCRIAAMVCCRNACRSHVDLAAHLHCTHQLPSSDTTAWCPPNRLAHPLPVLYLPCCVFWCPEEFRPVQRELVIDIDISDYDELRTCGSGGHICSRCWPFMAVAIQVRPAARLCAHTAQRSRSAACQTRQHITSC